MSSLEQAIANAQLTEEQQTQAQDAAVQVEGGTAPSPPPNHMPFLISWCAACFNSKENDGVDDEVKTTPRSGMIRKRDPEGAPCVQADIDAKQEELDAANEELKAFYLRESEVGGGGGGASSTPG